MTIGTKIHRADWLAELRAVALTGLALGTAATIFQSARDIAGPVTVDVPSDHLGPASVVAQGLSAGARIDPAAWLTVRVDHPSAAQTALAMTRDLPAVLIGIAALIMLVRIIAAARNDRTFTADISRELRQLGWLTLGGYGVYLVLTNAAAAALVQTVSDHGFAVQFQVHYPWLLAAFAIFAVAEIVRRGSSIRTELDEVI